MIALYRTTLAGCLTFMVLGAPPAFAAGADAGLPSTTAVRPVRTLDLWEIVVDGNTVLDDSDIQETLLPFMGPGRTPEDVDNARSALEKLYADQGFKTVSVTIPKQVVAEGTVRLLVTETRVRRLNVLGSRYHSPQRIRREAGSLAEGSVPDFTRLQEDVAALNASLDLSVTPNLKNGPVPGTLDVDLNVVDKLPLHGMAEFNNRYSQNTGEHRVSVSLSYDNLWQKGHSASLMAQTSPERVSDGLVLWGNYVIHNPRKPWTLQFNALSTDSDVSTLGGSSVIGKGKSMGMRWAWQFPVEGETVRTLTLGLDLKRFRNLVLVGETYNASPLTYYPVSVAYSHSRRLESGALQWDGLLNFAFSSLGSDGAELKLSRYHSTGQMLYLRSGLSWVHYLPKGFEWASRASVQLSEQPLIANEQLSAGGMDSVRGYLESEAQGDYGATGSLELRGPSLPDVLPEGRLPAFIRELRPFVFVDGASLRLHEALVDSDASTDLLGIGAGINLALGSHVNAVLDFTRPMTDGPASLSGENRFQFRLWTTF